MRCFKSEKLEVLNKGGEKNQMLRLQGSIIRMNLLPMKLPKLSIKLHHRYVCVGQIYSISRVWYYSRFHAPPGDLGTVRTTISSLGKYLFRDFVHT